MPGKEPLILAVDGTGMLVRCSRVRGHDLRTAGGVPTGTLTLFIGSLSRKIRMLEPDYLAVAWDGPSAREWRQQLYRGYKGGRPAYDGRAGDELSQVIEFCDASGIAQFILPGFEADDLLAAVTRVSAAELPGSRLMLCSDDQDLLQLLDARTVLTGLTTDPPVTADDVVRSWGCEPRYLPWVRALAGDPSDGIPGIRSVGRIRAVRILEAARWQWPPRDVKLYDDGDWDRAETWRQVMDLHDSPRRPEDTAGLANGYFSVTEHAKWDPRHSGDFSGLHELFGKYELSVLSRRLEEGRLW